MLEALSDWFAIASADLAAVGFSLLCGALLGSERELRKHSAGLRTLMLITVGACLFTLAGRIVAHQMSWPEDVTRIDPGRLPSYVVAGIGFLGAGPIIAHRGKVRGLTTAALIWVAAAIGMMVGLDRHALALITTIAVLGVLRIGDLIGSLLYRGGTWVELRVTCHGDGLRLHRALAILTSHGVEIQRVVEGRDCSDIAARYPLNPEQNQAMLESLQDMGAVEVHGAIDPVVGNGRVERRTSE